jgi:hypothetical protein
MSFFNLSENKFAVVDFEGDSVVVVVRKDSLFDMHAVEGLSHVRGLRPGLGHFVVVPRFVVALP